MTELTMTEQAERELAQFEPQIEALVPYGELTVAVDGIKAVEEAHKAIKRLMSAIEKRRVELKAGALEYGRTVDKLAKYLDGRVETIASKLKAERDAYEAAKLAAKQAEERAKQAEKQGRLDLLSAEGLRIDLAATDLPETEWQFWLLTARTEARKKAEAEAAFREQQERKAKLVNRIAALEAVGHQVDASDLEQMSDDEYRETLQEAVEAYEQRLALAEELKRQKEEREREQLRQQQEALRIEREAMEAERQRMAAERAEIERVKAEEAARSKAEQEAREAQEREERRQTEAAERARIQAEEEVARIAREEAAKPEEDRLNETFAAFAGFVRGQQFRWWHPQLMTDLGRVQNWMIEHIRRGEQG